MKAWHIKNSNEITLEDCPSVRKRGEVKLKLFKASLSSKELVHLTSGSATGHSVPGHSAIGYVSEADEDSGFQLGSRVVISPFMLANEFGKQSVKTMGVNTDGLLRDFVCMPAENVFPLPDGITDEQAVFTDYIAMANKAIDSVNAEKGDYVVIVGANTLGLILSQLASYYQLVPVLIDLDLGKLSLAKSWGISYTLNPTYDNLERRVVELTGGRLCDAAIFAGEGTTLDAAIRLIKDDGEVILAGYSFPEKHSVDMDVILKKQLKIRGINNGYGNVSTAINLLANKIVRTDGMIHDRLSFDEVPKAVEEGSKYPYKFGHILITQY